MTSPTVKAMFEASVADLSRHTLPSFTVSEGAVYWNALRLDEPGVERLLDLFEALGDQPEARAAFNELYACHMRAGGIARCSSLRLVTHG